MNIDFYDCVNMFKNRKKVEKRSVKTIKCYLEELKKIERYCMNNHVALDNINNIDKNVIIQYINYLSYDKIKWEDHPTNNNLSNQQGLKSTSVNNTRRILNVFFNFLKNEDVITNSPLANIKNQPVDKNNLEIFTTEQIELLLNQPNKHTFSGFRDFVIMIIMLDNGIRINELLNIKIKHINFSRQIIKINETIAKTNKTRFVPISTDTIFYIKQLVDYCRLTKEDYLILNQYGEKMTNGTFEKNMKKYGRDAGIIDVRCSPHTLRHTFATNFLINGGDVFSLQVILGHASQEMVQKYVHFNSIYITNNHNKYTPIRNYKYSDKSNSEKTKKYVKEPRKKVMFNQAFY